MSKIKSIVEGVPAALLLISSQLFLVTLRVYKVSDSVKPLESIGKERKVVVEDQGGKWEQKTSRLYGCMKYTNAYLSKCM